MKIKISHLIFSNSWISKDANNGVFARAEQYFSGSKYVLANF
jgi:hypothetical protein